MAPAAELVQQADKLGFKLNVCSTTPDAPIVVLMGWYGCQDKHLAKYSEVVNKMGYTTLRTVLPPAAVWHILPTARQAYAAGILDFLLESGLCSSRKLVFYMFSNGGCFVYQQIYHLMDKTSRYGTLRQAIAGCIFDSSPAYMSRGGGRRVFLTPYPPYLHPVMTLVFMVYAMLARLFNGDFPAKFWHDMMVCDWGVPQLYLYSMDDKLTDGAPLEALIETQRLRGTEVYSKQWQESEHVGHMRLHRDEYTAQLGEFLTRCFSTHK